MLLSPRAPPPGRIPPYSFDDRPSQSVFFHNVKHIALKGVTIRDSPCWTVTFSECEDIKVHGLTVRTDLNIPNDDGLHFCSCKGVTVLP